MATYQIAFHHTTKTVTIQAVGDALPAGANKIGEFVHDDELDKLGADNHVVWHHVRDALYHVNAKTGQAVPATLQFPENITDMAGITLVIDGTMTVLPVNTVLPTVTGTTFVGEVQTSTDGTWTPAGLTFTRKWQRAATDAGPWTDIAGATNTTYTTVQADSGHVLRVVVTAALNDQTATANSEATETITEA